MIRPRRLITPSTSGGLCGTRVAPSSVDFLHREMSTPNSSSPIPNVTSTLLARVGCVVVVQREVARIGRVLVAHGSVSGFEARVIRALRRGFARGRIDP